VEGNSQRTQQNIRGDQRIPGLRSRSSAREMTWHRAFPWSGEPRKAIEHAGPEAIGSEDHLIENDLLCGSDVPHRFLDNVVLAVLLEPMLVVLDRQGTRMNVHGCNRSQEIKVEPVHDRFHVLAELLASLGCCHLLTELLPALGGLQRPGKPSGSFQALQKFLDLWLNVTQPLLDSNGLRAK
jgi:hypothetical protein